MTVRIHVQPGGPVPIYRQIVDRVRLAVATGEAEPGEPLPSVRSLAERLVVNPNTVAKAYAELSREGHVESRPGRGVFVARQREVVSRSERLRRLRASLRRFLHEAACEGFDAEEIRAELERALARAEAEEE